MMKHTRFFIAVLGLLFLVLLPVTLVTGQNGGDWFAYLPLLQRQEPEPLVEFRGLWVTRFDWTSYGSPASPDRIDEIVEAAATAGFNAIFFQVRGVADAYYAPGLEPWAWRVSGGALGQPPDPLWDPLAYFIEKAHQHDIQLHAYVNVFPVWDHCATPPPNTTPEHLYHLLVAEHGETEGKLNGLQWDSDENVHCSGYVRATPASTFNEDHFVAVVTDLVTRYELDGIHLDHVRYGGRTTSCDPVSAAAFGADCFSDPAYAEWQRQQVSRLVARVYTEVLPLRPGLWLSAAVWPIYQDYWGWGGSQGYSDYYQDSKGWIAGGYIDALAPMIYPASYSCPYTGFWTPERFETLVNDYQADNNARFIIPGIGAGYCTFDEIETRIQMARAAGTVGHAIFSYTGLANGEYFDDLAAGPYAIPAISPVPSWHP